MRASRALPFPNIDSLILGWKVNLYNRQGAGAQWPAALFGKVSSISNKSSVTQKDQRRLVPIR
jgi:hypothetical protein